MLSQSRYEEAADLFRSLLKNDAEGGYAFRGLVRAYENLEKPGEAQIWIADFLEANPGSTSALYGLGYLYYQKEDMVKAEEYFKKAIASDSQNALALNNLGAVLARQKSYTQAADKVREAIRVNPLEPMYFHNLEAIYKQMGNPGLIIADYNNQLEQGAPEVARGYGKAVARSLRQEAFRLYEQGRYDDAIAKFLEIETVYAKIKHEPGLVPVYFSLGLLYEEKGDAQKAKKYFMRVLALSPMHLQARDRLNHLE
ncbi:hypothetical protein UR09_04510 [Candidatus Nitromaritima sp. SCGC AAA799-A02]|nr:hypothetical protein UR09_04510 [Candidatus Nitromaritima sp. SCGC AAA799-A02]KMP12375.1 hypothetical protein UZ36_01295 [Candidatus Nitromaritima sp. SCGC AAA799-C22]